jgi:hypothetical protein
MLQTSAFAIPHKLKATAPATAFVRCLGQIRFVMKDACDLRGRKACVLNSNRVISAILSDPQCIVFKSTGCHHCRSSIPKTL